MLQSLSLTLELRKSIDSHTPFIEKRVEGCECKWLTADIKGEMYSHDQLHRKVQQSRKEKD